MNYESEAELPNLELPDGSLLGLQEADLSLQGVDRNLGLALIGMAHARGYGLSEVQVLPEGGTGPVIFVFESLPAILQVVGFEVRDVEYEASLGLVLNLQALLGQLVLIVVHQGEGREPPDQQILLCFGDSHAVADTVAAVEEAVGGVIIFASSVDQFGRPDHQVPRVEETVYFDELVMGSHFGGLSQGGHQKLCFKLL